MSIKSHRKQPTINFLKMSIPKKKKEKKMILNALSANDEGARRLYFYLHCFYILVTFIYII